jgi:AAA15 family ATPase/GTPase
MVWYERGFQVGCRLKMIIIEKLEINNFKNIEKFEGEIGDLNILIGPNNTGKSNVLNVINRLSNMECEQSRGFSCDYCNKIKGNIPKDIFGGINFKITESDRHRKIDDPTLTCTFNKGLVMYYRLNKNRSEIAEIFSDIQQADKNVSSNADVQQALNGGLLSFINYLKSNKLEDNLFDIFEGYYIKHLSDQLSDKELKEHLEREVKNNLFTINLVYEKGWGDSIYSKGISILSEIRKPGSIISEIIDKDRVLPCSDLRVNEYKGKPHSKYILEKGHTRGKLERFVNFINRIVDPPIHDIRFPDKSSNSTLALLFDGFEDSIESQGSGTRSLIGLAWDIITMKEGSIIIIDEPELGLHPSAKQELLSLLLEEAKTKQIFIATHDPTFVNPIIWSGKDIHVSVLLYSIYGGSFVNVDLNQSTEDPETFAGYGKISKEKIQEKLARNIQ